MTNLVNQLKIQCPDREQWQRFLVGKISTKQIDSYAKHLMHCDSCGSQLQDLRPEFSQIERSDEFLKQIVDVFKNTDSSKPNFFAEAECEPGVDLALLLVEEVTKSSCDNKSAETKSFVTEPQADEFPEKIGKYEIVCLVGKGGFGCVYKAYNPDLEIHTAIKVPRSDRLNPQRIDDFISEAQTLAKLQHPNIVPVYDAGRDDSGSVFVAMKWIDGETLLEYRKRIQLGFDQIIELATKICNAVHFAHQKGFVHRDLKPENILVDKNGEPFVCDFGMAIHESVQIRFQDQVAGSYYYMSPEQIRGESHYLDGRTDVWSLGVIFYELVSNKRPFNGRNRDEVEKEILERSPKPLLQFAAPEFEGFFEIIHRCLEKDVDKRMLSAGKLAEKINKWQEQSASVSAIAPSLSDVNVEIQTQPETQSQSEQKLTNAKAKSRRSILVLVAIPFVAACAFFFWFQLFPQNPIGRVELLTTADDTSVQIKSDRLFVSGHKRCLVSVGNTKEPNFKLEFSIEKSRWEGEIGFFIALDNDQFQLFYIRHPRKPTEQYELARVTCRFDSKFAYAYANPVGSAKIGSLPKDGVVDVKIIVRNGKLFGGTFNGAPIRPLTLGKPNAHIDCSGKFGFFLSESNCVFRDLKFQGVKIEFCK